MRKKAGFYTSKILAVMLSAALLAGCGGASVPEDATQAPAGSEAQAAENGTGAETGSAAGSGSETSSGAEAGEAGSAADAAAEAKEQDADAEAKEDDAAGDQATDASTSESDEATVPVFIPMTLEPQYDYVTDKENYRTLVSLKYPLLSLDQETAKQYPELKTALQNYNKGTLDYIEKDRKELKEYAEEMIASGNPMFDEYRYLASSKDDDVIRSDSSIVSILESGYWDGGGVHPNSYYLSANFDPNTGNELYIKDILQNPDDFPEIVDKKLHELYPEIDNVLLVDNIQDTVKSLMNPKSQEDPRLHFTVGYGSMFVYFSPYDLTVYAAGPQIIQIKFDEYPDLVKPQYQNHPENYMIQLVQGQESEFPMEEEDETSGKTFSWESYQNEETFELNVAFTFGGEDKYEYKFYGWDPKLYLIHNRNQNYLWLDVGMESDYQQFYAFQDLDNLEGKESDYVELDRSLIDDVVLDPDKIKMYTRTDVLSTYMVYRTYHLDDQGMPVSDDTYDLPKFWGGESFEITAKKEVPATLITEEDGVITEGKETSLKKGDKVHILRTDADAWYKDEKSWVDVMDQDGHEYRIRVERGEDAWQVIGGTDINELFDGLMFAG